MRSVYACVFDVVAAPEPSAGCFARLRAAAAAWVGQEYLRQWGMACHVPPDGGTLEPAGGHRVQATREGADDCEWFGLSWVRPDQADPGLLWATACELGRYGDRIQASVALRISSLKTVLRPLSYTAERPRLVDDLFAVAPCFFGPRPVPTAVTVLGAEDVPGFVDRTLVAADRALPVVMVAPDPDGRPAVDPAALLRAVLGLAQVAVLRDRWATFALTDALGRKELSCFNGAARLYWPGFRRDADPLKHPLYLPERLRWLAHNDQPLDRHLARTLMGLSAFRFSATPVIRSAREGIERRQQAHVQGLLDELRAGGGRGEIEAELERAWDEARQLKAERDEARDQAALLSAEVEELTRQLEAERAAMPGARRPARPESAPTPGEPTFANVAAAVRRAREEFPSTLVFLPSAEDSAADSPYQHGERAYQLFQALDELVRRWRVDGKLGETWYAALKQRGFDYKDDISMTSRGKYGDEYRFLYEGRRRLFENHVTIGSKSADTCLSVHWLRDDDRKAVVVGWCGRHLTNTLS